MKPYLRAFLMVLTVFLCLPGVFWAQTKKHKQLPSPPLTADGAGGTPAKKAPVATDDDIAKLTVRKSGTVEETLVAKSAEPLVADPEKAKAEIVTLRQEINDKQRRVEWLMSLFVLEEQRFIRNPSGEFEDDDLQQKRRDEQEELKKVDRGDSQAADQAGSTDKSGKRKNSSDDTVTISGSKSKKNRVAVRLSMVQTDGLAGLSTDEEDTNLME